MSNNKFKQQRKMFKELRKRHVCKSKRRLGRRLTSAEMGELVSALKIYAKRAAEKRQQ